MFIIRLSVLYDVCMPAFPFMVRRQFIPLCLRVSERKGERERERERVRKRESMCVCCEKNILPLPFCLVFHYVIQVHQLFSL